MIEYTEMQKTSGCSQAGIPPSTEEGDLLDEMTPFFKRGIHYSKKKMENWRSVERQIKHVLDTGTDLSLPSTNPLISEGRKQVISLMHLHFVGVLIF